MLRGLGQFQLLVSGPYLFLQTSGPWCSAVSPTKDARRAGPEDGGSEIPDLRQSLPCQLKHLCRVLVSQGSHTALQPQPLRAPPSAVPTQAPPSLLQALGCLPFTAKCGLSASPTPAVCPFVPRHPSPGREWGQGGARRGARKAAGRVPGIWTQLCMLHPGWLQPGEVSLLLFHLLLSFFLLWSRPPYHFH